MTITTLHEIPRDRYGRPMVIPADGGKPQAYTRCTTFVSCLEDTYNLSRWQQRMVALGLAERPDLMLQIASTDKDDKKSLNKVCEDAMEAAKAHAAATIGTALHALTERIDRGEDVGVVPEAYQADLDAYTEATKDLNAVHIEAFSVNDEYKIGGTTDRVVEVDGKLMIADIKTGSVEWGMGKIAMQLAVYANSQPYSHETGQRGAWGDIDLTRAIVIHLPAGTGTCELIEVDIAAGWEAVHIAAWVRGWRGRKNLSKPYVAPALTLPDAAPSPKIAALEDHIATAISAESLSALWVQNQDVWNDDLTALAKARITLLDHKVAG